MDKKISRLIYFFCTFSFCLIVLIQKSKLHSIVGSFERQYQKIFNDFYQIKEYDKESLVYYFVPKNNCQLCKFTVRNKENSNSSPKDVVMSSMFHKSYNLIPFIRTLRTTGSKCGIIIFTDSILYKQFNTNLFIFLQNCGCLIINSGKLSTNSKKKLFMARNMVIYTFLQVNYKLFERIIIVDLYDTIFQGDPFYSGFLNDTIGFSLETTKIQGDHLKGILIFLDEKGANKFCYKKLNVNCGTILGTSAIVLKFLKLFMNFANSLNSTQYDILVGTRFPDQIIVNALICGGFLDKNGMKYHLYPQEEQYVSLHKVFRNRKVNFTLGNFIYNSKEYPLLIHLFDRSTSFCKSVLEACPSQFNIPFSYARCLNIHR